MRGKPAGADPFASTRVVRRGVIEAGAITRGGLIEQERHRVDTSALEQLQELASSGVDVCGLSAREYRARRQLVIRLLRQRP
jgi:hypothetical protein